MVAESELTEEGVNHPEPVIPAITVRHDVVVNGVTVHLARGTLQGGLATESKLPRGLSRPLDAIARFRTARAGAEDAYLTYFAWKTLILMFPMSAGMFRTRNACSRAPETGLRQGPSFAASPKIEMISPCNEQYTVEKFTS